LVVVDCPFRRADIFQPAVSCSQSGFFIASRFRLALHQAEIIGAVLLGALEVDGIIGQARACKLVHQWVHYRSVLQGAVKDFP
jgi:hypothetical protein